MEMKSVPVSVKNVAVNGVLRVCLVLRRCAWRVCL